MTITYAAQTGTDINSPLVSQTISTQTGGNNQIQLSSTTAVPSGATGYGSNVGDGTSGLGDVYVGRRIILRPGGGTEEVRKITAASGSNPTLVTVDRDWDTNPASGDVAHVPYEFGDIEDGGTGGGINLNSKSGLFELSNILNIKSTGALEFLVGHGLEGDDQGNGVNIVVESGGRFYGGFDGGNDAYVDGGINTNYNNAAGEPSWQIQSGGRVDFYDMLFWAQLFTQQFENANGSDGRYYRCKWLNLTDELHLFDSLIRDCSVVGKSGTAEIIRVDAGTDCIGLILSNVDTLETASGDTTTETITLSDVTFLAVTDLITLVNNKTWNMIDPVWTATLSSHFNDSAVTGSARINERRRVDVVVQTAGGTVLQDAVVLVYEGSQSQDLVFEDTSDANGVSEGSFVRREHDWIIGVGSTTAYGTFAFRVDKWLYTPFFSAQSNDEPRVGPIIVVPDNNIVQTTQATAITDGTGITFNKETNPSSIIDYTAGSGTLLVGMVITGGSSGADGIVTKIVDGDSAAGTVHLKTRDAVDFTSGETVSRTGGTAGTWSATFTGGTQQDFSIWIGGNAKSFQTIYDFLAAVTSQASAVPFSAASIPEKLHEWANRNQARALYSTGSSFYTERSGTEGVFVTDYGAGAVDYFTDDVGGTWTPPTSVTLEITVKDKSTLAAIQNVQTSIRLKDSPFTELMNEDTLASGIASEAYDYIGNVDIVWRCRKSEDTDDPRYFAESGIDVITSGGFTLTVLLEQNPFLT